MDQPSLAFDDPGTPEPTLSVLELTTGLREALRRSFPDEVWVRGEVQNPKLREPFNAGTESARFEGGRQNADGRRSRLPSERAGAASNA